MTQAEIPAAFLGLRLRETGDNLNPDKYIPSGKGLLLMGIMFSLVGLILLLFPYFYSLIL